MKCIEHPLSLTSPGTRVYIREYVFSPDQPDRDTPRVYIQAGLHADEWPGLLLLQHLLPKLKALEESNRLKAFFHIIPFANPLGLNQTLMNQPIGRFELTQGQNFNRGFVVPDLELPFSVLPDRADLIHTMRRQLYRNISAIKPETLLQEMQQKLMLISSQADYVLDLHCDQDALGHVYCFDAQMNTGQRLAEHLGFNILISEKGDKSDAFDSVHFQPWLKLKSRHLQHSLPLSCFASTIELRGKNDVCDRLAHQDSEALLRFFTGEKLINTTYPAFSKPEVHVSPLAAIGVIMAPESGLIIYDLSLGKQVTKGDTIGWLIRVDNETELNRRIPVTASTSGILFGKSQHAFVRAGQLVAMIAGQEKIRGEVQISS